jgi:hypothetical protein
MMSVMALALGGGLLATATGAQQYQPVPPAYDAPPPLGVPPQVREQPPSGGIQLYTRPGEPLEPPALPPPRPYPHAGPSSEPGSDTASSDGSDWSPGDSLQIQTAQGIRYVSGGVGEDERAELEALSGQFNLRLLFAMQGSGDYLADVRVRILDPSGAVVLSAESKGPWFFAQLPPDTYTVEVSALGQSQRQTARIGPRQFRLNFYWR